LNLRPHEGQQEDQKPRKTQECHLEEGKPARPTKTQKVASQAKMIKKS
jgi:hypothetical protein